MPTGLGAQHCKRHRLHFRQEQPFSDVDVHVRVVWPGDPNALCHSRALRQWDNFHWPADTQSHPKEGS